ncbi:MAG: hypothetical protein GX446_16585 [Chthonomonadales bacterium]|nr:hypothetical protein [Chthonomonadales bacterium]
MLCLCFVGPSRPASEALWGYFASTFTANLARDDASRAHWAPITGDPSHKSPTETLSIWGDYCIRFKGFHTGGNNLASGIWHD